MKQILHILFTILVLSLACSFLSAMLLLLGMNCTGIVIATNRLSLWCLLRPSSSRSISSSFARPSGVDLLLFAEGEAASCSPTRIRIRIPLDRSCDFIIFCGGLTWQTRSLGVVATVIASTRTTDHLKYSPYSKMMSGFIYSRHRYRFTEQLQLSPTFDLKVQ